MGFFDRYLLDSFAFEIKGETIQLVNLRKYTFIEIIKWRNDYANYYLFNAVLQFFFPKDKNYAELLTRKEIEAVFNELQAQSGIQVDLVHAFSELIEKNEVAISMDLLRTGFKGGIEELLKLPVGEAVAWFTSVLRDWQHSHLHAAYRGWKFPMTIEAFIQLDQFAVTVRTKSNNYQPKEHRLFPVISDFDRRRMELEKMEETDIEEETLTKQEVSEKLEALRKHLRRQEK